MIRKELFDRFGESGTLATVEYLAGLQVQRISLGILRRRRDQPLRLFALQDHLQLVGDRAGNLFLQLRDNPATSNACRIDCPSVCRCC